MTADKASEFSFEKPFFGATEQLDQADYLAPSVSLGGMSVAVYRNEGHKLGVSNPNEPQPVYMLPVFLRPGGRASMWRDGRYFIRPDIPAGAVVPLDLRSRWRADLSLPFHNVQLYVPQRAFDELTGEYGRPKVDRLSCDPREVTVDLTTHGLALAVAPIVERGLRMPGLLSDGILASLRLHLALRYGGLVLPEARGGGLSPAQQQLCRALLLDDPRRDVRLAHLADLCGMPPQRFVEAFRQSFGLSPHRWRMAAKIDRARNLLEGTDLSIAEVALVCGFSDQAHLTRLFARRFGLAPAAYRRSRRA